MIRTPGQKIVYIVLLLCSCLICQGQSLLDKKIDFLAENQQLTTALLDLSVAAEVNISMVAGLVDQNHRISISAAQKPLQQVLEACLAGTQIGFRESQGAIILYRVKVKEITITGYVSDKESGERLIGANILLLYTPNQGVATNNYGFFSLPVKARKQQFRISYLGYQTLYLELDLKKDQSIKFELSPSITLQEILVNTENDSSISLREELAILNMQSIRALPASLGEPDLLQSLQLLPGVTAGADGIGGIHVRGGNTDQNLILIDDTPIYNPSHSIGLFSILNPELIKSVAFYRSGIPATYGGRLSSVLDVRSRDGSSESPHVKLSAGILAATLTVESPLFNNKGGFLISARRTHLDAWFRHWSTKQKLKEGIQGETNYHFYDIQAKAHYAPGLNDRIYISFYSGGDRFSESNTGGYNNGVGVEFDSPFSYYFEQDFEYKWGNQIASLRWNHLYGNKLFSNLTLIYSQYRFKSEADTYEQLFFQNFSAFAGQIYSRFSSEIQDVAARLDYDYFGKDHQLQFGANYTRHKLTPGVFLLEEESTAFDSLNFFPAVFLDQDEFSGGSIAHEAGIYFEDQWKINNLEIVLGLRADGIIHQESKHLLFQPRFQISYRFSNNWSIYTSIEKNAQLLHLLSLLDAGFPNDMWVAATEDVPPQKSWQISTGLRSKLSPNWSIHLEAYSKRMSGLLIFQNEQPTALGPISLNAENWEDFVLRGNGQSIGIEALLQYQSPTRQIWLSYTLSKSDRFFEGLGSLPFQYDHRHQVGFSIIQNLSEHWSTQAKWTYQSGMPATTYIKGVDPGFPILDLLPSDRPESDNTRLPAYHRLDISFNYHFGDKIKQEISFGVYNIYNRQNAFAVLPKYDITGSPENRQINGLPILPVLRYEISFY